MRAAVFVFLTLTFSGCNNGDKLNVTNGDAYGENEIAEPKLKRNTAPRIRVVEIVQMSFVPDVLNVNRGDTVVWVNKDLVQHDVTELNTNLWRSPRLATGASWKMVFDSSQVYHCSLHVVMKGKIVVNGNDVAMINVPSTIPMCDSRSDVDQETPPD